jgi:hypothetical protein
MKLKLKALLLILITALLFQSCDTPPVDLIQEIHLKINVNHVFGSSNVPFELEKDYYITSMNDTIKPTTMIYHINNFELSNDNGDRLAFEYSYALVDLLDKNSFALLNKTLPSNKSFSKLSFTVGVEDSLINKNGILNTLFASPMYWGMTNGYIHFKLEGLIKGGSSSTAVLHVGGYLAPFQLAKRITVNLASPISGGASIPVQLEMDMSKYFNGIDLDMINSIHQPSEDARKISDNWPLIFQAK